MLTAIDSEKNKVFIDDVSPNDKFFCPVCQQKLIQKRKGVMRRPHFAHLGHKDPTFIPCPDKWGYDISDWHSQWQEQFPVENIEVVVEVNGVKHRADVLINDTVVEFQHSGISYDEFKERNEFYLAAGYDVIWVFDLQKEYADDRIHKEIYENKGYIWSNVKRPFKQINLEDSKVRMFLQFIAPENNETEVLEYLNSANSGFKRFLTDEKNVLSTKEFIALVTNRTLPVIFGQFPTTSDLDEFTCEPKKRMEDIPDEEEDEIESDKHYSYPEKPHLPPDPNGKTVYQLWNPDYQFMIVRNTTNMDEMVIHGKNGRMTVNQWGKIEGTYSNRDWSGKYYYSKKRYTVTDANKPYWILLHAKETEEAILKREIPPIPSAETLMDLIRKANSQPIIVRCLVNGKAYYVYDITGAWSEDYLRINSIEIDVDTGELYKEKGTQNGFIHPRRGLQIWELIE